MRFILILFSLLFSSLSFASPTTGGFAADAVLAMKPELITDTSGVRYWDVPVVRSGVTGVARVAEDYAVGRVIVGSRGNLIGLAGMAAIEAAKAISGMCVWDTDKWHDCTQRPSIPINIDTSQITPATSTQVIDTTSTVLGNCNLSSPTSKVGYANNQNKTYSDCLAWQILNDSFYSGRTVSIMSTGANIVNFKDNVAGYIGYWGHAPVYTNIYSCSSGTLTNSSGAPMPVTGQFCTPVLAYSCPLNYIRTDSSGNVSSSGMFCSFQSPVYTDTDAVKILAPYLLNYYANQLFNDKNGKPLDVFSAPNTTFDPAVTPSTMPMTWEQLKQYVDWVRNKVAQTTDPLAPHYISPNNYDYTKNYINNNTTTINNIDNSTSSSTSTGGSSATITPEQVASSAAMTQSQYEASNKKADDAAKDSINATDTSSMDNYRTSSGFDGNQGDLDKKIIDIGGMASPVVNPTLDLPQGGACRQIPLNFSLFGHQYNTLLPTDEWCAQLQKLKQAMAYFMYILTAVGIVYELIRRPVEGN